MKNPMALVLVGALASGALAACQQTTINELEAAAQVVATAAQSLASGQVAYGYVGNVDGKGTNAGIIAGQPVTSAAAAACAAALNTGSAPTIKAVEKTLNLPAPVATH